MLSVNSLSSSLGSALTLNNKGVSVSPKSDSVLNGLVSISDNQINFTSQQPGYVVNFLEDLLNNKVSADHVDDITASILSDINSLTNNITKYDKDNNFVGLTNTTHNEALINVVGVVGPSLSSQLSVIKNVVVPLVKDYADKVITAINSYTPDDLSKTFNIIEYDIPAPLKDASFLEFVRGFADSNDKSEPLLKDVVCVLGEGQDITSLLMTPEDNVNKLTLEWLADVDSVMESKGFIARVWNVFFQKAGIDDNPVSDFYKGNDYRSKGENSIAFPELQYQAPLRKINVYTAIFLIANYVFDKSDLIDQNNTSITLTSFRDKIVDLRRYAAQQMISCAEIAIKLFDVTKLVVITTSSNKHIAYVYAPNYAEWLTNGGINEAILGAIVDNKKSLTASNINEMSNDLTSAWRQYALLSTANADEQKFKFFDDTLTRVYAELLLNPTESEKEYSESVADFAEMSKRNLINELKNVVVSDMNDVNAIHVLCTKIICRTRFYYTEAERVLLKMIDISNRHSELTNASEVATLATISYVCDWLRDQIVITKSE